MLHPLAALGTALLDHVFGDNEMSGRHEDEGCQDESCRPYIVPSEPSEEWLTCFLCHRTLKNKESLRTHKRYCKGAKAKCASSK